MSPKTHNTLSPLPFPRNGTSVVSEDADPSQFPRQTPRDSHRNLAPSLTPERRQWPPRDRKFWIHESPSSSSSQDGKSNTSSSGSKSTGSENPEERRVRTVSPYGAFFAEEMEFDTPAKTPGECRSLRQGDEEQEHASGVFPSTRKIPSKGTRTSLQAQMAPVFFVTGYSTFTSAVPAPPPEHDATRMKGTPFSPLSLAESSRRSLPPLSWRQGHLDHPDDRRWDGSSSQCDPPPQVATAVPCDKRQTHAMAAQGRRRGWR
ncbi:hypothetical protein DFH94DRAFT_818803 [Russula ochroleuca]|jgi:hypothetical protein|uniref:Uncharacterized protein n=1 Tax=Russula ochroleuca TaxID=152965 RepID=A0A9P5TBU6_9AGAM|nr:hypothetical protein DFH94DRAFT_818803 [Russula ochroleuca]